MGATKIRLNNVRLSFSSLFTPKEFKGNVRYSASFLIPKDSPDIAKINDAIMAALDNKFGKKAAAIAPTLQHNPNKFCFRDGDRSKYESDQGHMIVVSHRKETDGRPMLVDRARNPLAAADGVVYDGCYVNAMIEFFGYDNTGPGVSASLISVQFSEQGEAFTGVATGTVDDFEELGDTGEAYAPTSVAPAAGSFSFA